MTKRGGHNPIFVAFVTIFLDLLGFGIIIPIQPFYAEHFGATATVVTLLGASYSLMQFIFAPLWGRLSDRIGRRPIILTSVAMSAVGHLVFGFAGSLTMLFAARMLAGFGNANLGTAQAIISDSTTRENRSKGMGLIGAAFGLGFILGPAIGGLLGQWGANKPPLFAGVLAIVNLVLAWKYLPETLRRGHKATHERAIHFRYLIENLKRKNVGSILMITLISAIAFSLMEQVIGLAIEARWVRGLVGPDVDPVRRAALLTSFHLMVVGVTATIVQGGLIGRFTKIFREVKLIRTGLFILVLGLISIPLFIQLGRFPVFLITAVILAFGTGILNPSSISFISQSVDEHDQGGILGLNQSQSALGRVLGPSVAGYLFEINPALPFWAGAGFMMIAFFFSFSLNQKPKEILTT